MRDLKPWLALIFKRPGRLLIGGLFMLGALMSGIALLAVSGWFITETALVGILLAAGVAATINLYVPGGAIRLFALTRTVFRYAERLYNHDTVLRLLTDIRAALYFGLSMQNRTQRSERRAAQWLSRLTSDVDALDTLYLRLIAPAALAALVSLLMTLLAWWLFDGQTALFLLLILTLAGLLATVAVHLRTRALSARQSDHQEQLRTSLIEHIEGFAELTAAGRAGKHGARLMRRAREITQDHGRMESRIGWHQALSQMFVNLAAVAALATGIALFQADRISGPVLVLLPIAILGLAEAFALLPEAFGKLGATQASARRLNRDSRSMPTNLIQIPPPPEGFALTTDNLAVRHPGHSPVLSHLSLQVKVGERLGILGRSGSGKSSLADSLAGLLPAAQGALSSQPLAYLTQGTVLFEDTLRANLVLGNPVASDTELWSLLEQLELAERFASEPNGLDTWLGNAGCHLSGGEARRVALARVLLSRAPLLILDEPFTGLDADTRTRVSERMEGLTAGKTVISLAHGPDALPGTDRVIHLMG